ncbi:MAG: bifunctional phosphoribosylaminoimidazolecarboxamide formyltransferase/IMP cyclohydrolase [Armatimonadota bacterium]
MYKPQRALISVSDKTGIVEFAQALTDMGVEILSTGGTRRKIEEAGIDVRAVEDYTGYPEIMDHRVVTLHPKVHGALLALRDNEAHMQEADELDIEMIDMVVCNLYPFEETVARDGVTMDEAVDNIDIGGPTMLRSAAKNHKYVTVVCSPDYYDEIIEEMQANDGAVSSETRRRLALETFVHTGKYDAAIVEYLCGADEPEMEFPRYYAPWYSRKGGQLRYGENPHQEAAVYAGVRAHEPGLANAEKLHGEKDLSFNNYLDLTAAMESARDFEEPTAIIIKHLNPCGAASADDLATAFTEAWTADPISAFGSVLGFNREVDVETAELVFNSDYLQDVVAPKYREESGDYESIIIAAFVEAIIAPGYTPEALEILKSKSKNMRVLVQPDFAPAERAKDFDIKRIPGGIVAQTPDVDSVARGDLNVVTTKQPTDEQIESLLFADKVAKHVKSNAIVLVQDRKLVGCGGGQMSRIDSCIIAARKAGDRAKGACLASDAMFPARDGLDAAAETGAAAIIQPGGSRRDDEVIEAADEHGLPMVMTGMRHFWH